MAAVLYMNDQTTKKSNGGELRLLHLADLHLGSPFSGLTVKESEARRQGQLDLLASAIRLAAVNDCHAILIPGDLFDCGYVGRDTVERAFEILAASSLPTVIAPGNHDPYSDGCVYSTSSLPKNVYVFDSAEMSFFDIDELGLRVHGYAFESERYTSDPLAFPMEVNEGRFNVLCAHGDIYSPISTYAPLNLPQLEGLGLDYVALGHIHKYSEPLRIGRALAAYSGFPEGRSFDECGPGGALIVTLMKGAPTRAERLILSERQYLWETLDATGAASARDVMALVKKFVAERGLGKETCLRLTLVGNVDPSLPIDIPLTAQEVGTALLELKNDMLPVFDADFLENDITLRGALYRQLLPSLKSPDAEARRVAVSALRMGLAALEGRALTK